MQRSTEKLTHTARLLALLTLAFGSIVLLGSGPMVRHIVASQPGPVRSVPSFALNYEPLLMPDALRILALIWAMGISIALAKKFTARTGLTLVGAALGLIGAFFLTGWVPIARAQLAVALIWTIAAFALGVRLNTRGRAMLLLFCALSLFFLASMMGMLIWQTPLLETAGGIK